MRAKASGGVPNSCMMALGRQRILRRRGVAEGRAPESAPTKLISPRPIFSAPITSTSRTARSRWREGLAQRRRTARAGVLDVDDRHFREAQAPQDALAEHLALVEMRDEDGHLTSPARASASAKRLDHRPTREIFDLDFFVLVKGRQANADNANLPHRLLRHVKRADKRSAIFVVPHRRHGESNSVPGLSAEGSRATCAKTRTPFSTST